MGRLGWDCCSALVRLAAGVGVEKICRRLRKKEGYASEMGFEKGHDARRKGSNICIWWLGDCFALGGGIVNVEGDPMPGKVLTR